MSVYKDAMELAEETKSEQVTSVETNDVDKEFDATVATIPLANIVLTFANTRRKISQVDIDGLKASINSIGLISAVTVKPTDNGKYELIAGFKRFEAMSQLGKTEINAIVLDKDTDEAQTTEANLAENFNRSGLSLADQCTAIKRLFTILEGDDSTKAEIIAVRLNMTSKKVNDRLLLTALIDDAMIAFDDNKIALKTATILAGLPDDQQTQYLEKLVKGDMTHDDLLSAVGKASVSLSLAKFDKSDCQQCPSNSEVQSSLFVDTEDCGSEGTCKNIECFKQKSQAWFDKQREEKIAEFGTVIPVSQVEQSAISLISADLLGDEQIKECSSCSDNISLIHNKLSEKFGNVMNNVCRNKTCFTECAAKFATTQQDASNESETVSQTENAITAENANLSTGESASTATTSSGKTKTVSTTNAAKISKAGLQSARIAAAKIQIEKGLSEAIDSKMLMFLAVMRLTGDMYGYNVSEIKDVVNMDDATLKDRVNNALLSYLKKGEKESGEESSSYPIGNILLTLLSAKGQLDDAIIASWTVAELKHTTKAGIKQILTESGFKDHLEAKEKGSFAKLMACKVPDIHKALADADFDFSQYAPKAYIQAVQKVANGIS